MSIQFFRYAASGSANLLLDWVLYFLVYNFVLKHQMLDLGIVTLSSHIASLIIIFPIISFSGFLLQKYVTFSASPLRGSTQLLRYVLVVVVNLLVNYIGLKLLVDGLQLYPTPSKMVVTIVTILVSYICQKTFTFRNK